MAAFMFRAKKPMPPATVSATAEVLLPPSRAVRTIRFLTFTVLFFSSARFSARMSA